MLKRPLKRPLVRLLALESYLPVLLLLFPIGTKSVGGRLAASMPTQSRLVSKRI